MRKKKCKNTLCGEKFTPPPDLLRASVCSSKCGVLYGREMRAKAERRAHRKKVEGLKTKSQWLKETQAVFNKYIRVRDQISNRPCVSCGRFHQGQWHAGHYRAVGGLGAPLRFNEINIWRQCSACNNHLSGNLLEYRIELIKRIGLPLVEWLEKNHPVQKWTIDELKALKKYYRDATKALLASTEVPQPF